MQTSRQRARIENEHAPTTHSHASASRHTLALRMRPHPPRPPTDQNEPRTRKAVQGMQRHPMNTTPTHTPTTALPTIRAARAPGGKQWVLDCPYCHSFHFHAELGQKTAPCNMGQYIAYKRGHKPAPSPAPTPAPLRLVRDTHWLFTFEPKQFCKCGGELVVADHRPPGSEPKASERWRYETSCYRCNTCDPNGWSSKAKVIAKSPAYFR